ncbi:major capsid protein [Duodenibacillus massiliensis]|uniref:major capsid protein n=1 Tax=Duodenibacillus massiliensis TaxID=1852381 RepID=UPI00307D57E5
MSKHTVARQGSTYNRFAALPQASIQRSVFNRSHDYKTTFDSGYLVPFYVDEVLPGDSFKLNCSIFCRLATPIVPFMDNLYLETFFFFVPNRLVWKHWENFMGQQDNPGDSTDYLIPQIIAGNVGFSVGSVADYFGIPTGVKGLSVSSLPFRAYQLIYNEWFRDENLQNRVGAWAPSALHKDDPVGDWNEPSTTGGALLRRNKYHDYFTSALPWPQKGDAVDVNFGVGGAVAWNSDTFNLSYRNTSGQNFAVVSNPNKRAFISPTFVFESVGTGVSKISASAPTPRSTLVGYTEEVTYKNPTTESVSVSSISPSSIDLPYLQFVGEQGAGLTINDLRQAFQVQKLLERDARGGTRYTEILRSHFGVVSPDARLQRPEYLGGSSTRILMNSVAQTAATNDVTPQANLSAFGLFGDSFHGFSKSFVEHGYIIGLVNVRADLSYQQGLNRMWSRKSRLDFYFPVLAHLGEQAILNKEIYAQGTAADDQVFGYQERFAEYRYSSSVITGKMRSTDPQTLDIWHLAQKFDNLPTLSSQFIQDNPPVRRVVAVQSEPQFILDAWFDLKCVRPMPVYSVPGLVDHF